MVVCTGRDDLKGKTRSPVLNLDDCEPAFKLEDCTAAKFEIENCTPDLRLDSINDYFSLEECAPSFKVEDCLPPIQICSEEKVLYAEQQNIHNFKSRSSKNAHSSATNDSVERALDRGSRILQLIDEELNVIDNEISADANPNLIEFGSRIKRSLSELRNKVANEICEVHSFSNRSTAA